MRGKRRGAVWVALVLLSGLMTVTVHATEETRRKIDEAEQEKKRFFAGRSDNFKYGTFPGEQQFKRLRDEDFG